MKSDLLPPIGELLVSNSMCVCVCVSFVIVFCFHVCTQICCICQVQQRGVDATADILSKLLEGLSVEDSTPVLLVDCLPNRFLDLFI